MSMMLSSLKILKNSPEDINTMFGILWAKYYKK